MDTKSKSIWNLIKTTFSEWSADKASRLAAALAYYTVFSLAPLLVIAIAVAAFFFGQEAAQGEVVSQIEGLIGQQGAEIVQTMLRNASESQSGGIWATIIGLVTLFLGATTLFGQLQDALNTVWGVEAESGGGIMGTVVDRLLSFVLVLGIGLILLLSLVISAVLPALQNSFGDLLPGSGILWQALDFIVSFGILTLVFAVIYKVLPDVEIAWSDVWVGAAITALLFTVGKILIGLYLGLSSVSSSYGAAGSLVVLLLWVYYSAQIVLLGAEFTQVYANWYGSHIRPDEDTTPMSPETRARQGMKETKNKAVMAQSKDRGQDRRERAPARSPVHYASSQASAVQKKAEGSWSRPVWLGLLLAGTVASALGVLRGEPHDANRTTS